MEKARLSRALSEMRHYQALFFPAVCLRISHLPLMEGECWLVQTHQPHALVHLSSSLEDTLDFLTQLPAFKQLQEPVVEEVELT